MSGGWLISYVVLWLLVVVIGGLLLGAIWEIGILRRAAGQPLTDIRGYRSPEDNGPSVLGKATLGVAALMAGVGMGNAEAACGDCPSPCCAEPNCGIYTSQYAGCCKIGITYWVTMACLLPDGSLNCYWVYSTGNGCPHIPVGAALRSK